MIIRNHLLRYFGDEGLTSITTVRVNDFKADVRNRSCSPSYINDAVAVLKMLLRQAVERDVIADYPLKKRVQKRKETPLRLELKRHERAAFFAIMLACPSQCCTSTRSQPAFRVHGDAVPEDMRMAPIRGQPRVLGALAES